MVGESAKEMSKHVVIIVFARRHRHQHGGTLMSDGGVRPPHFDSLAATSAEALDRACDQFKAA
jgi:hypothetical protein